MFHPGLLILMISTCLAEDKWVWSKNHQRIDDRRDRIVLDQSQYDNFVTYENNRIREYQRERDREYERQRDRDYDRQRDREQTTRRPPYYGRPEQQQNNNDYDDYDATSQEDQNKFDRYGPKNPGGPGVYPFGYGGLQNLIPNPLNGILVGPGGPTGQIGRPAGYREQYGSGAIGDATLNHLRPNPANGILVGPGGPTGIIGRPPLQGQFPLGQAPGNVGPQVFPGNVGSQGFPGNVGPLGFPGNVGQQGFLGNVGPQGFPGNIGPQVFPGVGAQPQGTGSTGPQLFPGVGVQPQGSGPIGPQAYPGGQLFQPNPNFAGGLNPGSNYGFAYGAGLPFGYPGGIGGGLNPDGYGIYPGQTQSNGYGFFPSQYYPNNPNIPFGGGQGSGGNIPYNNDIGGDIGNNYAPGYNFGIEGKSKKNENIKAVTESNDKNVVKKSVNNKLLKF